MIRTPVETVSTDQRSGQTTEKNFKKGIDIYVPLWYNKNVPIRYTDELWQLNKMCMEL